MDEESGSPIKGIIIVVVGLALVVAVMAFLLQASKPGLVQAPKSLSWYTAVDKSFVCGSPVGWESSGAASHGVAASAAFKKGAAVIDVGSDLVGSLMGDVAASSNAMASSLAGMAPGAPEVKQRPPVEKVHIADRKRFDKLYKEYDEGRMTAFQSRVGEARCSEFTADGGFGVGKLHGFRVTILGGERRITVVCRCPEANWEILKPTFQRVIASMNPGTG